MSSTEEIRLHRIFVFPFALNWRSRVPEEDFDSVSHAWPRTSGRTSPKDRSHGYPVRPFGSNCDGARLRRWSIRSRRAIGRRVNVNILTRTGRGFRRGRRTSARRAAAAAFDEPVLAGVSGMSRESTYGSRPSFPPSRSPARSLVTARPDDGAGDDDGDVSDNSRSIPTTARGRTGVSRAALAVPPLRSEKSSRFLRRIAPSVFGSMRRSAWKPVCEEFRAESYLSAVSLLGYRRRPIGTARRIGGSRAPPAPCRLLPKLISR